MSIIQHPTWELACEELDSGDIVHRGAPLLFAGTYGVIVLHRVQCDDYGDDGEQQTIYQHEVRIERIDQPRGPQMAGDGYDPGPEHYTLDDVATLAALAEAQDDDEGRELAALLRDVAGGDMGRCSGRADGEAT